MPEILISVINKIPRMIGDVRQITSNNGDYTVRFQFDDQWTEKPKTVIFARDTGYAYAPVRTVNDTAPVPIIEDVRQFSMLYIGVQQGGVKTSRVCGVPVYETIIDRIEDDMVQPEPSMWADILARVEALEENSGSAGEGGAVYVLEEGETLSDVPEEYDLAYDPYAEEEPEPENEYITQEQLEAAVEEALTEAKESGAFKGDDYVLTDDDKAEIAEQAAALVDTALLSAIGSGVIA